MSERDIPGITCLCPTHGRFSLLRELLSSFLSQTYEPKYLIILNDAPVKIDQATWDDGSPIPDVLVVNADELMNLNDKRQALLERAETPLVAHFDDDDLYLPWHLSEAVHALIAAPGSVGIKGKFGWRIEGWPEAKFYPPECHPFEAQLVLWREGVIDYGYLHEEPAHGGKSGVVCLREQLTKAGKLPTFDPAPGPSFVWRKNHGHKQYTFFALRGLRIDKAAEAFAKDNQDYGEGFHPASLARVHAVLESGIAQDYPRRSDILQQMSPWRSENEQVD